MITIVEAAGWPIYFLLIASVVSLGLIVERLMFLRKKNIVPPDLLDETIKALRQSGVNPEMIQKLSEGSLLGRIFAAGLKNITSLILFAGIKLSNFSAPSP